ncbi:MAG: nucleotidyltransferase domain-containing protein [Methanomassiliicoccaceae archaeon]|nr:nucleotidyltransferase domain-containing protein [Methanomassiliicoccaceae archaeon]
MSPEIRRRPSVEELKTIVKPVAEKYGVEKVYLFGSAARGDHTENSDYDFCIELGKIRTASVLSEFFQDLREAIGREIDLVTARSLDSEFFNTVMTEGIVVYEQ